MSDIKEQNGASATGTESSVDKGKGKAVEPVDVDMSDESSDEESVAEDAVPEVDEDEEGMEAIDTDNIISDGRRTRGKTIDFAKAAAEAGDEDEEEEDDEDFQDPEEDEMKE